MIEENTATEHAPSAGPLAGIRVLELCNVIAGPTTCQVLGDFGAEIIKIEHPADGDGSRSQGRSKDGKPLWWKMLGRNKRSVGMYLGDPEVAETFLKLVATADVIVEGFRPGTLEKWNLGYNRLSDVNPGIILARITGYGQEGPYSGRPAFGSNLEAMAGLPHLTGDPNGPPTMSIYALGDYLGAVSLVGAIMFALYHRDVRGGGGQVIDASLLSPMMTMMSHGIMQYDQLGIDEARGGNRSTSNAPRNIYKTLDEKWISVAAATTPLAERIMRLVGAEELTNEPWFATGRGRAEHVDVVDGAVAEWIRDRTRDEVMLAAAKENVTFAPVYSIGEMVEDLHVRETNMLTRVRDDDLGDLLMPNVMFNFSATPGRIKWTGEPLGKSTDAVLNQELGVDNELLREMRSRGAIR
ncbi:CaiB/BaiF CoA transferase family protein [Devosia naphthalenivorans]|uniref:CaiB/BaiF CoA transferase family protein n=1 Tax=Devosia naphthalenivorans TaxID=2082392 RepID=UPI000D3622BC|nr:CoA transferase [Devosia naphthalenivorans]